MKKMTIRVFTAFSGYESQMMALLALQSLKSHFCEYDFVLVGWCEIDDAAIKSHNAVFPMYADVHYKDITKIDWSKVPDFDLFFYSSCCQSVSLTGSLGGMEKGSGTQSSLIWYALDAIKAKRPKYCVLENVPNMASNTFMPSFIKWQRSVDSLGYKSYAKVLSAADYGIPQNRKRLFLVSMRDDVKQKFDFPMPMALTRDINSFLDNEVEGKYYFKQPEVIKFFIALYGKKVDDTVAEAISDITVGHLVQQIPTLTCSVRDANGVEHNVIPTITASAYANCKYNNLFTTGRYPKCGVLEVWEGTNIAPDYLKVINSAKSADNRDTICNAFLDEIKDTVRGLKPGQYLRLRRMTPREQFRFMGVPETYIERLCNSGNFDADLYKQAGNSIVVDVLVHIFSNLFNMNPINYTHNGK